MKQKLLLLLAVLLPSISASAYDFEVDGIYYNILSEREMTCEVTYKDQNFESYSGNVSIPSTVTFRGVTLSVTSIGENAFRNCTRLISAKIPNTINEICNESFRECTSLTSLEIPNSVKTIGGGAFMDCSSLTSMEIPNSVFAIGGTAFGFCTSLTSVIIPTSVIWIGETAFYNCTSLTDITSLNPTPPTIYSGTFDKVDKSTCVLKVPTEAVNAYKAADYWKDFFNIDGITATGINSATLDGVQDGKAFNLQGQPVNDSFKGVVVRGGKKFIQR